MKRRKFIGSVTLIALGSQAAALLSGCTKEEKAAAITSQALTEHESQTLFAVSRALFPHASLADEPYIASVQALDRAAAGSESTKMLLQSAVTGLDDDAAGDWLAAAPEQKVAVLEQQQGEPYFRLVLNTVIDTLYRDPGVWAVLGYEGSSLEHGGYLTRGFDDISWLPSSKAGVAQ